MEQAWRCTCGGRNGASLEINLDAVIEQVCKDALGGHYRANLQALIKRLWTCTSRP